MNYALTQGIDALVQIPHYRDDFGLVQSVKNQCLQLEENLELPGLSCGCSAWWKCGSGSE